MDTYLYFHYQETKENKGIFSKLSLLSITVRRVMIGTASFPSTYYIQTHLVVGYSLLLYYECYKHFFGHGHSCVAFPVILLLLYNN